MSERLGIGFLGAGPVTQAIHLPTLAWRPERFRVITVMDVDPGVASAVARRCGASGVTSAEEVIEDPRVEIVAICSPNAFHADQLVAACRAGKRAVLCEKPLATSREEAHAIRDAAALSGTAIFVGTMHAYDPAYRAAQEAWADAGERAELVRSTILLPANSVFVDQATEVFTSGPGAAPRPRPAPAALMRHAILGLAIHNIPLVRDFYPAVGSMAAAAMVPPFGYSLTAHDRDSALQMIAMMPGGWPAHWTLTVAGERGGISLTLPPSYVLSGGARAEVTVAGRTTVFQSAANGYESLWTQIGEVCAGRRAPAIALDTAIADLEFALDLADGADRLMGAGA